jgi:hypothetical protein
MAQMLQALQEAATKDLSMEGLGQYTVSGADGHAIQAGGAMPSVAARDLGRCGRDGMPEPSEVDR